jgi:hypothetical protein
VLVLAPDRGFLGNEKTRDVVDAAREHTDDIGLAIATYDETRSNLSDALPGISTADGVVVMPLFLSAHHTLYRKARKAMPAVDAGVQWAAPFGRSYLSEEILFDRVASLLGRPNDG